MSYRWKEAIKSTIITQKTHRFCFVTLKYIVCVLFWGEFVTQSEIMNQIWLMVASRHGCLKWQAKLPGSISEGLHPSLQWLSMIVSRFPRVPRTLFGLLIRKEQKCNNNIPYIWYLNVKNQTTKSALALKWLLLGVFATSLLPQSHSANEPCLWKKKGFLNSAHKINLTS